ncbi:cytochrome c oxidase assembly protein subunit 15 [Cytobacillus firmus]|uniref:Cytochrome c oxidase assembly protein subunit 15 n=2 Tax=Cytobacillus TaxID=2675230 RepID=A0A366JTC9_CYTFI|nr:MULTISPECIES: COX15/CtaA family protein [Cytobacillus]RBP92142.1 cytochrome c oxidase assembly protein subunit 15 [Cytobacillus firmus]TDX42173.1 cytochrome c oxidase assembly protein subunit 15 [Cytobacillus oceanisediminis]
MKVKRLAFLTIVITYFLIVFGGYVASSESGMGCGPEWPLCNGKVIPILEGDTLIEFAHRVIGAVLGIMTAVLYFSIQKSNPVRELDIVSKVLMLLLLIQILLGAAVVWLDLPAVVVSVHLMVAMLFLAALIWIWRNAGEQRSLAVFRKQKSFQKNFNGLLIVTLLTLFLGAYIKHQSLGLSCGWLECANGLMPVSISGMIQTGHRILAGVLAFYILILTYLSFKNKCEAGLQNRLMAASLLVLTQIIIGVLTIISYIELSWAVLHLAFGTALFAIVFEARVFVSQSGGVNSTWKITRNQKYFVNSE